MEYKQLLEKVINEETYKEFFKNALKKYGVKSPAKFKDAATKKEFFDYIEKNWTGEKE